MDRHSSLGLALQACIVMAPELFYRNLISSIIASPIQVNSIRMPRNDINPAFVDPGWCSCQPINQGCLSSTVLVPRPVGVPTSTGITAL